MAALPTTHDALIGSGSAISYVRKRLVVKRFTTYHVVCVV